MKLLVVQRVYGGIILCVWLVWVVGMGKKVYRWLAGSLAGWLAGSLAGWVISLGIFDAFSSCQRKFWKCLSEIMFWTVQNVFISSSLSTFLPTIFSIFGTYSTYGDPLLKKKGQNGTFFCEISTGPFVWERNVHRHRGYPNLYVLLASKQESNFASKMRNLDPGLLIRIASFFAFTANCTTFSYDNEDNEDNKGQGGRQHALMSTLAGWLVISLVIVTLG